MQWLASLFCMLQDQLERLKLWWLTKKHHYFTSGKLSTLPTRDDVIKDAVGFVLVDFKPARAGAPTQGQCPHIRRGRDVRASCLLLAPPAKMRRGVPRQEPGVRRPNLAAPAAMLARRGDRHHVGRLDDPQRPKGGAHRVRDIAG